MRFITGTNWGGEEKNGNPRPWDEENGGQVTKSRGHNPQLRLKGQTQTVN